REDFAFSDQRAGTHQTIATDDGPVQDHSLNADQGAFTDRAAVQHGLVADGDMVANGQRVARIGVQDGTFLDVGACSYGDGFVIATNDRTWPDTAVLFQYDLANQCGLGGNKAAVVNLRGMLI